MTPRRALLPILILLVPAFADGAQAPKGAGLDGYGDALPPGAVARLGTGRLCHPSVHFLAFSPDGKRLATVGYKELRLWEVASGKRLQEWAVPQAPSYSASWSPLAFSPDGQYVALGCRDKTLRLWESATGREILKQPHDFVTALAFGRDGQALAVTAGDRVRVYDPRTGRARYEVEACKYVNHVAFSADGKTLIAVGNDKPDRKVFCIYAWDAATGQQTDDHFFEFASWASQLSPDGKYLVIPEPKGGRLRLWDTGTGKQIGQTEEPAGSALQIAFSGDGTRLATLNRDGQARIWQSATGKLVHQFAASTDFAGKLALSADGKVLATVSRRDQAIHLWDTAKGKELHAFIGHRSGPLSVAFAADGKSVLSATRDPGFSHPPRQGADWSLRRWDYHSGKELDVWRRDQESEVRYAVFSPDGRFLALANSSGLLRLIDCVSGKDERTWSLPTEVITMKSGNEVIRKHDSLSANEVVFSADGALMAVSGRNKITLYDTALGKQLRELIRPLAASVHCSFFPDGKSLVVSDWTGGKAPLVRIDAMTGEVLRRYGDMKNPASVLAVGPKGDVVAVITGTVLHLLDADSGKVQWTAKLPEWSFAVAFSGDGRLLATGGRDAVIRLWDCAAGTALHELPGHNGEVTSLLFSRDNRWLVSGGGNTGLVWDLHALAKPK